MSVEFLKNLYSELLQEKSELELEQSNIVIKLKENEKYIKRLKIEEEENYDAFSPRNQNQDLKKSIHSFEKKKTLLLQKKEEVEEKLNEVNDKVQGFEHVFQEEKEEESSFKRSEKQKKKCRKLRERHLNDLSNIIYKLEFCSQLVEVDPVRCKLELSSLIKMLYDKIDDNKDEKKEISKTDEGVE